MKKYIDLFLRLGFKENKKNHRLTFPLDLTTIPPVNSVSSTQDSLNSLRKCESASAKGISQVSGHSQARNLGPQV